MFDPQVQVDFAGSLLIIDEEANCPGADCLVLDKDKEELIAFRDGGATFLVADCLEE